MSREQQVRDAIERFLSHVRQQTDTELEALSTDLLGIVQGDMRTNRADLERAAVEVARAVAKGGTHARHDLISRVLAAVRHLDEAATLRGILEALADGAADEASRVAVLLVQPPVVRAFRHHGFPAGAAPVECPVDASPLLASAIALKQTTLVHPVEDKAGQLAPAFMRVGDAQLAVITPLLVAGSVVAVLYAQGSDAGGGAPVWAEHVEVLVRHASSRLETVTSKRTVDALAASG